MKDVIGIESRFEFNKAIGAGLAKEINALYNDGGHGRLTLPIGVCSAPSCWSPWAVSTDRRHLQGVELLGEESGNLDGDKIVEWLCFILEHILAPNGITISGTVTWRGTCDNDLGMIVAKDGNQLEVRKCRADFFSDPWDMLGGDEAKPALDDFQEVSIETVARWNEIAARGYKFGYVVETQRDGSKYAVLTGGDGHVNMLELPNEIDGLPVKSIGDLSYYRNPDLTSVSIPCNVTKIEGVAFKGCRRLKAFSVAAGNTCYKSIRGLLLSKDGKTLIAVPGGLKRVRIPAGVQCIGKEAFFECEQLESVTIPDSVIRIEEGAFWRCRRLKDVQVPHGVTSIGDRAFLECGISDGMESLACVRD